MQKRKRRLHLISDCRFVMGGNKISVKMFGPELRIQIECGSTG